MARRPGLRDLAEAAGLSLATVDRALNGRQAVRPETRAMLAEVAARIGHPAARRLAGAGSVLPQVTFGVVLHKQGHGFYKNFAEELHRAVASVPGVRGRLVLEFSTSQSPSDMAGLLRRMRGRCDVLAATSVNHPEITAAVEELREGGLSCFSLLSEFAQGVRVGYLGLNNLKVGRTAGWMIGLAAKGPGKVAIFVGGHRWHGHELRETGFRSYLREAAPRLAVLDTLVNLETRQLTYEATLALIARHSDLRAIYVAGGGMEGAIAAVREARPEGLVLVVSALTPESRTALAEGVVTLVTDTPLQVLCQELFARMTRVALEGPDAAAGAQVFLPPDLHVRESI